ncbi:hypothetical protein PoB_000496700 [Plakobranchus ocellatus]|uniref:Uncharacterized protein n=1 Tax=Plakobranchus ocellatus TaxID=259542 RepID=A0AAV3Y7N6_9GAST|nr:hypothetical protein PoB_000496700 [Plakobranchus ocellatus]
MGRSRRWPTHRHHIAEHTSACARSPWTSHPRPPSGQSVGGGVRTRDRRVLADLRTAVLAIGPPNFRCGSHEPFLQKSLG